MTSQMDASEEGEKTTTGPARGHGHCSDGPTGRALFNIFNNETSIASHRAGAAGDSDSNLKDL
jgi:hypothetical protein